MSTSKRERFAAILVGLEGIVVAGLVAWQVLALLSGDTGVLSTALALVVLTAVGAAAVLAFSVAIWRDESWGRSGAIVTQLLILAVALGAATGEFAHPITAVAIALPAVLTLVLLVLAVRSAAVRERGDSR
ncbi:histidine kinase [Microbacterium sp. NPDC076911]|uniref:histidine kinase n=1 Tax=Microbacterium sp. NPDC076911 TaxID=3154958 RepID=UPI0034463BB8